MPRKKTPAPSGPTVFDAKTTTAPCVPALRDKVAAWRAADYPGATDTTRRLLNHWFLTDHRLPGGRRFAYHYSQRHAIETLIYLYEVAKVRRQKTLIESFAVRTDLKLLQYDDFARYCVKMATGSGKTKVMALAVAWQFFNAVAGACDDYAKTFLVIAPNVIVFERLRADFAGGRIFRHDPMIPEEWANWLQKKYPSEFGGARLLIIHTNRSGEVAVKDPDAARSVARDVDDGKSPANCIVSVVMLRKGWDVQSVTVIVGCGNLRFYEPDFVAVTDDGASHLIETKGLEDVHVANKDRAARIWCENATRLTGKPWSYLKVPQAEYGRLQASRFADVAFLEAGEREASAP